MTAEIPLSSGPGGRMSAHRMDRTRFLLAFLCGAAAALLFCQNNGFPLGVQPDEPKKVEFILSGRQDFMHPILMLQVSRFANLFAGFTAPQDVAVLGRTMTAVFGGLFVAAVFLLVLRSLSSVVLALAAAASLAVAPLTFVHAQILKEDVYLAAMTLPALLLLIRLAERPTAANAALFGLLAGLAASAKHVGILVPLLALPVPFVCALPDRRAYWRAAPFAFATAAAVYAAVNFPALLAFETSYAGLRYEVGHVAGGHGGVFVSPLRTYFVHYVRDGFIKGLGPFLALTGVAGMILAATRWRTLGTGLRVPLLFAGIWYFAHELAPMKPGVSRYMVPAAPMVVLFAGYLVREALERRHAARSSAFAGAALVLMVLFPARITAATAAMSQPDTRAAAESFAAALGGKGFFDGAGRPAFQLAMAERDGGTAARRPEANPGNSLAPLAGWDYLITANVTGTFVTADQPLLAASRRFYGDLYRHAYVEVSHLVREYEFRNRRYRIVDLKGHGERLKELAESWPWPRLVRWTFTPAAQENGTAPSGP